MLSEEAKAKLREVKAAILANPKFYDQNQYINEESPIPMTCGTTCCIAGWADFLFNGPRAHNERAKSYLSEGWWDISWPRVGSKALGLDEKDTENLFDSANNWPAPFDIQYAQAKNEKKRAKVAARRINFFIKTNGTDKLEA